MDTKVTGKKIVIVEDEEVLVLIFKDEIQNAFPLCEVIPFTDSVKAYEFLRDNPVDIIVTDGKMPHKTGVELARELNEKGINTPKLLVTGHVDFIEDIKQEGLFQRVFEKPVDFDVFLNYLDKSLKSQELTPSQ